MLGKHIKESNNCSVFNKEYNYYKLGQLKSVRNLNIAKLNELDNCTFNPTVNTCRSKRPLKEFICDQSKYALKTQERMRNLIHENMMREERNIKTSPSINQVNEIIL